MRLIRSIGRTLAALALTGLFAAPIAQAERGHGRSYHRHDYEHHRDWRHYDRRHDYSRRSIHRFHRPGHTVVIHRPPVYYPPARGSGSYPWGVTYGPYYHPGTRPRYHIGHHYTYAPGTIYIRNYGHYGLYAPPPGYHWVRDPGSGDAILAAVATGAIIGLAIGALAD